MRLLLNVIWLVFGGFWLFLGYVLAGVLLCIPIITIPWAIASFRIAGYALWPFGRTIVAKESAGVGSFVGNVIWFVLAGWWLVIAHVVSAVVLAITIIGIPLALADLKLIPISLAPLGKDIVASSTGERASAVGVRGRLAYG
ncbi:YccF domain-containing protein [Nocardioides ganghwensis]|uniref:YccF domain-containing protein n=1 Tax=Nocardioides ganghwensis TaxID=252230 RepID=A0A4Q2S514_9ACTN|nr:YccF domain-containing protein [Nocardioides ganghwensis]MBD3944358.1 YccF domain-containing protein [Nocardioides ganghwensis]RYB96968.1 YccF domain-containing protein [Nocardioides ganghwensis]